MRRSLEIFNRVFKQGVGIILLQEAIVKEDATEEEKKEQLAEIKHRYDKCESCPFYIEKRDRCRNCGCFMEVKTGMRKNRRPSKNRIEVTHCPIGLWWDGELEIANEYRAIDGKEFLTEEQVQEGLKEAQFRKDNGLEPVTIDYLLFN